MDFKDDLCRILIICGIPIASLGDPLVKARGDIIGRAFSFVNQAVVRAMRN